MYGKRLANMFGFVPSPFKAAKWEGGGAKGKAPQKNVHPKCFRCDHQVRAKDESGNGRPVNVLVAPPCSTWDVLV